MSDKPAERSPWSVPVRRDDVPESGLHFALAADAATRAAVARMAGVAALPQFGASFDVTRRGNGLRVSGEVTASVEQNCIVTLEPMTSEIREPVDVVFLPEGASASAPADEPAEIDLAEIDPEAADEPEPLHHGTADLGAVATEFLLLAIDPYPRKPGVVFEPPAERDDPDAHPFAALAALRKPADRK
jgi:uncharacterized metal-binding protein YceD (DUF177 family)